MTILGYLLHSLYPLSINNSILDFNYRNCMEERFFVEKSWHADKQSSYDELFSYKWNTISNMSSETGPLHL